MGTPFAPYWLNRAIRLRTNTESDGPALCSYQSNTQMDYAEFVRYAAHCQLLMFHSRSIPALGPERCSTRTPSSSMTARNARCGREPCLRAALSETILAGGDRTDILGVQVSAINLADAVEAVERCIRERRRDYVCVTGVHGVMESRRDGALRDIHNRAGLVTPDGMPLVWLSHLLGRSRTQQVCGRDLMRALTAVSALHGYRQFYYGGGEGVAETLRQTLTAAYPGIVVAGVLCPPFRQLTREEDELVINTINATTPDIVWVGLSTPKQERWMAEHRGGINAPVMIGVGAAFDFLAGTKRQPPVWMQQNGLEWLFRLCSEPRRLWRRYTYIVPGFLLLAASELLRRAILSPPRSGSPLRSQS